MVSFTKLMLLAHQFCIEADWRTAELREALDGFLTGVAAA